MLTLRVSYCLVHTFEMYIFWILTKQLLLSTFLKNIRDPHHFKINKFDVGCNHKRLVSTKDNAIPTQDSSLASTDLGMTHAIPTRQNMNANNLEAKGRCRNKWLTDSPSDLHKQHQSAITKPLFRILFVVNMFPRAQPPKQRNSRRRERFPYALPRKQGQNLRIYLKHSIIPLSKILPWGEGSQINLSQTLGLTCAAYKSSKKSVIDSNSQSCASLVNTGFKCTVPLTHTN